MHVSHGFLPELPDYPQSYWLASVEAPSYPRLADDLKTEAVVIGGGLTGITTAYMLAKAGVGVALIESGKLLRGTTAYSNGVATVQHGLIYADLIRRIGAERARLYYDANLEALTWIEASVRAFGIDCDFAVENAYLHTADERKAEALYDEREAYAALGIPGAYVDGVPLPIPSVAALKAEDQLRFNPLPYALFLLEEIARLGGRIYEHTTAVSVLEADAISVVETDNGCRIQSRHIVACTHFPLYDAGGRFAEMQTKTSYSLVVRTEYDLAGGIYRSLDEPGRSVRSLGSGEGKRLLLGGETHFSGDGDSSTDRYAQLLRHGVGDLGAVEVEYRWSANDLWTADKLPYVGRMPAGSPRHYVATGFGRGGLNLGTAAALLVRDLITGRESPYAELFDPGRGGQRKGIGRLFARLSPIAADKRKEVEPHAGFR